MISSFEGQIVSPDSPNYESARRVWNGAIDRRPALVANCESAEDVQRGVRFAQQAGLRVAVRGAGHSLPGHGTCDEGLVLNLGGMKDVVVDEQARVAHVGPGATWADFDAVCSPLGLATPGGDNSSVGVTGLALGGGIGWLSRKYGLTCDNLLAAELVTAEGELVRVDEQSEPDLLWALRGGGGNFGVVTKLTFKLHEVPRRVVAGELMYPVSEAADVLPRLEALSHDLPEDVVWNIGFTAAPDDVEAPLAPGAPMMSIRVCYLGASIELADEALAPIRDLGGARIDRIREMSYLELQSLTDSNAPAGAGYACTSEWVSALDEKCAEVFEQATLSPSSPMSLILINLMGGAVSRVADSATAFGHRGARYSVTIVAGWEDAQSDPTPHHAWTRHVRDALSHVSTGGGYVNLIGDEGPERVKAAYGEANYRRLASLKHQFDPGNFFRNNQNITPREP